MKAIIIDDEKKARILLSTILEENCKEITNVLTAQDLLSGIDIIKNEKPDIVFLDIEMPENSGLEILEFLDPNTINFEIIFTTAYSEYAVQAFELSAIDYLLKPLRPSKVISAVQKVIDQKSSSKNNKKIEALKESLATQNFKKIALPVSDGIKFVNFKDIIFFQADGMYTTVTTIDDEKILISKPLRHFTDLLKDVSYFYKTHRSYLINLNFIKKYVKSDGGYILMTNDVSVSISKDKREMFLQLVANM
ncbi:LytR/AlgR family response regulator transcription factor [Dokdonia sp. Hel_I_53]|uniref:LytR/AlgR family response regulator transcription factor n=1 Tax=Dokdonia sp. Hel_I_53 TaxID=1566287 RepID=UPI00119A8FD0|nr:LytTR family DNA-binding domain-containing protein [Dokdonia sp. Hel_I_53]TVZ52465.1 LytTR family two component transcriptional regulator [Dokdonia sp. Hel_I_53]